MPVPVPYSLSQALSVSAAGVRVLSARMWRWRRRPSSARCRPGVLTFTFNQLIESSSGFTKLVTSSTVNNKNKNNNNDCVARVAFFLGIYLPVCNSRTLFVQDLQQVSNGKHII